MENIENTVAAKKRTRRPNFSPEELKALVDGAVKRKLVINGAFNPAITGIAKITAWDSICKEVNATSLHQRTIEELKTKLKTYRSEAKKEVASYRREINHTGRGGPPPKRPSLINERVVELIGETALQGIDMGLEVGGINGQKMAYQRINHADVALPDTLAKPAEPLRLPKPEHPPEEERQKVEDAEFGDDIAAPEKNNKACQTISQGSTASGSLLQQGDLMLAAVTRIGDLLQISLERQAEANAQQAENGRLIAATLAAVSGLLHLQN